MGACTVDPFATDAQPEERDLLKTTEISKMKGQGLQSLRNNKMIAVNLRHINYAMKEGFIRIINQNGRDLFKVSNTTKAVITDVAINGTGLTGGTSYFKDQSTVLFAADERARVNVFMLEAKPEGVGVTSENRVKQLELNFDAMEMPKRVIGHPTETHIFITLHSTYFTVWDLRRLEEAAPPLPMENGVYMMLMDPGLCQRCGSRVLLPELPSTSTPSSTAKIMARLQASAASDRFRDATVSVSGKMFIVLATDALFVWKMDAELIAATPTMSSGLTLVQTFAIPPSAADIGGLHSVRVLGNQIDGSADSELAEVLVIGAGTGAQLLVYAFSSRAAAPVGPLLQSIRITNTRNPGAQLASRMEVNYIMHDSLTLCFEERNGLVVLPLATGPLTCRPFPYLQRFVTDTPAHQLSVMTGKSFVKDGHTLFLYRAHNFIREKDGLLGCVFLVNELEDPILVERESENTEPAAEPLPRLEMFNGGGQQGAASSTNPPSAAAAAAAEEAPVPPPGLQVPNGGSGIEDDFTLVQGGAAAAEVRENDDPAAGVGEDDDAAAACSSLLPPEAGSSTQIQLDWAFVKQIAACFQQSLDRRRGEMAEKILTEVREAMHQSMSSDPSAMDFGLLEQALNKVRDTKEAQAAGERSLQAAVRKATDGWAELTTNAVTALLQKELTKISDGVAATLAQQLSQSRKFCEALARGVQKCSGAGTKMALEAMRPNRLFQDSVNAALVEALRETLGPVFKVELRAHFEQELAPLVGRRVSDMLSNFRIRVSECLEGLAVEQEEAARRLGQDLSVTLAKELKHAVTAAASSTASAPAAGGLSEAQADEISRAVSNEIVDPLKRQINDLNMKVKALQDQVAQLEQLCHARSQGPPAAFGAVVDPEESQAAELERLFHEGKADQAFMTAIKLQHSSRGTDFLGRVCGLVEDMPTWLSPTETEPPLRMQTKMLMMAALGSQISQPSSMPSEERSTKVEWINELWLAFEMDDPSVQGSVGQMCRKLQKDLEEVAKLKDNQSTSTLRQISKCVTQAAKLLKDP